MQRPWNEKSETAQSLQHVHEILHHFMAVVVSSAFRKSLSFVAEWTKAPGSESAARICPRKSLPKRGLWESYFLQGIIGKTHTQNLQILREDNLGATWSAGPFCLLPICGGWYFKQASCRLFPRPKMRWWTFFEGSPRSEPLKMAILKGLERRSRSYKPRSSP